MTDILFSPKKINVPDTLVLIPHFYDRAVFKKLQIRARKTVHLLGSDVLVFQAYALVTGFLGYPFLLTLLEFIAGVKQKEIFFLGTAGSLNPRWDHPCALNVTRIHASSVFTHFSTCQDFGLKDLENDQFERVSAVSVDILQRETRSWLKSQESRGIDAVEMEIFPLRLFLEKPFVALVVLSDRVTGNGIQPFSDVERLKKVFAGTFGFIESLIQGEKSIGDR